MNRSSARADTAKGIACMVACGIIVCVHEAITKWLTGDYPVGEVLFYRTVFMFVPIGVLIWRAGGLATLATRRPGVHGLRAGLHAVATVCFVTGLSFLPLADAIALTFTGPLFSVALAAPMLGERVGWRRWAAVLVGFAGVVVMLRPTGDALQWVVLIPVAGALFSGVRDTFTRRITRTESSVAILFYSTLAILLYGLSTSPFGWQPVRRADLGLFALSGALIGCAQYLLIQALRFAEVAVVTPFKYIQMLWAAFLGFLVWGHVPDQFALVGGALVAGGGLYILRRESILPRSSV